MTTLSGRPQTGSAEILALVKQALDEFDTVPLEAAVRQTIRIANLLGDTRNAVRLGFEVKAAGGHPPANAEATRRLMADPELWGVEGSPAEAAVNEYMAERTNHEGLVVSHSLREIEFWEEEQQFVREEARADQYARNLASREMMVQIVTRARHHAFTLLCSYERQLQFAATQENALEGVSKRVDSLLSAQAPDVMNQFNAAFRRLREAVDRSPAAPATEELSQALTSCRRILKAVVDIVQPADPERQASVDGHALTDEQYKNRLVEFLKSKVDSSSFRTALVNGGETLFERFGAVDSLSSKAVHATVALEEAEYCALHTYLLAGEILLLHQDERAADL